MFRNCLLLLIVSLFIQTSFAQIALSPEFSETISTTSSTAQKYWVYFHDKDDVNLQKAHPENYLSQRAIERRNKIGIGIEFSDLPVSTKNIDKLNQIGATPVVISKWLNAVSVYLTESQMEQVVMWDEVANIQKVKKYRRADEAIIPYNDQVFYRTAGTSDVTGMFGLSSNQIEQINLDTILDLGYTGNDMVIAVLDAGFFGVDTATLFQSFWDKGQILGYKNFPDHNNEVFNIYSGYHGAWVMSVIGGDVADAFSGSAPNADFYLFRTEVADSEYVVEEDYWLAASEKADSVGADIINSSLGYTTFDDSLENHTYEDLDGNTAVVTKAGDMAAQKGILVCNSAGNEGANTWHYISMPGDGDSVFTIGGVDTNGIHVGFSGYGPTFDGRLKPNVVALALGSAVLDPGGYIGFLAGTSFSSPLIAGACASLWGAFPEKTNMEIMSAVERSAHLYLTPNDSMGYGIPNFGLAYEILLSETDTTTEDTVVVDTTTAIFDILPNPAGDFFSVFITTNENAPATIQFYDLAGQLIYQEKIYLSKSIANTFTIDTRKNFSQGMYLFSLIGDGFKQSTVVFVE